MLDAKDTMSINERRADDPRILRTKLLLANALLEVGATKPFAAISVADLITHARVSRSTFYDHFTDVEALLFQTLEEGVQVQKSVGRADPAIGGYAAGPPVELVEFLRHVQRNRALYRSALGDKGSTTFLHALRKRIEIDIRHNIGRVDFGQPLPEPIVAAAVTGMVLGILLQWIEADPLPDASEVAEWIWQAMPRAGSKDSSAKSPET
jgi:AcrR family transcriptional regulator